MYFIAPFISTLVLASGVVGQYGGTQDMGGGANAQQNQGNTGGNTPNTGMTGGQTMQNDQNGASTSMMMPPSSTSSASSATGSVTVHVIKVSDKNGSLIYSPASTNIPVGEMVQWHFYPKNHSVVQAAFSNPCEPISNVMPNMTTFFSGYMPVKATDQQMPALTMMVMDAKPFWYYCSQGKHCQKGMVGVINPPKASTGKTIEAFAQKAMTAPPSTIPGMTNGNTTTSSSNGTTSSGLSATGGQTSTSTPAPSPSSFLGAANNLIAMGITTFGGVVVACLM